MLHEIEHAQTLDLAKVGARLLPAIASDAPMFDASHATSHAALQTARQHLEATLNHNEEWRALQQLLAREDAGEWFDVIEGDVLRDRLARSLVAEPAFMAWQFVDAALACLDAANQATVAPCPASDDAHALASAIEATAIAVPAPKPVAAIASARAEIGLAKRIPTLEAHTGRSVAVPDGSRANATHSRTAATAQYNADEPTNTAETRFEREAIGVEEADVKIVVRRPSKPLIEARLPPSPFDDRATERGGRLPRASRATAVKWADAAGDSAHEFRPVGSALDEAHVAIIVTGSQTEAQSRAARRALGVAPDREQQMRRFFNALSGE